MPGWARADPIVEAGFQARRRAPAISSRMPAVVRFDPDGQTEVVFEPGLFLRTRPAREMAEQAGPAMWRSRRPRSARVCGKTSVYLAPVRWACCRRKPAPDQDDVNPRRKSSRRPCPLGRLDVGSRMASQRTQDNQPPERPIFPSIQAGSFLIPCSPVNECCPLRPSPLCDRDARSVGYGPSCVQPAELGRLSRRPARPSRRSRSKRRDMRE